jgi:hypothetical protein
MKRLSFVVLAAATLCAARSASAQLAQPGIEYPRSDTRGWTLGVSVLGSTIPPGVAPSGVNSGVGMGAAAGYGLNNHLSLFARGDMAYHVSHVDVGARYSLGSPESRLRPYLEGALTRTGVRYPQGLSFNVVGLTGGAGVQYFVRRNLALDVGAVHSFGKINSNSLSGAFPTTRLSVGFNWHP